MPEEKTRPAEVLWAIALEWFPACGRSALSFLGNYLCPRCAQRLAGKKDITPKALLAAIQGCCAQSPDFIGEKMPVMEAVFRLFLRNGNRPLTLAELSFELGKNVYGDNYRTSPETLARLLKGDRYYGLREITS